MHLRRFRQEQYKTPFMPLMPGASMAKYMDLDSAAALIVKGKTAAVFVEPVQGEGGINVPTRCVLGSYLWPPQRVLFIGSKSPLLCMPNRMHVVMTARVSHAFQ
jgi:hypothetical protein